MRLRQRIGLRAGIAILTAGTALLEIALHRTFTALFGQHIALAALPLALVGAGAGAITAHLAPRIARPPKILAHLGYLAALAAAASLAALLLVLHVKPADVLDRGGPGRLISLGIAGTAPFFVAGLALAATFRHAARDLGRLGFTVLSSAALAGPLSVIVLRVGAPRAALLVVASHALASVAFYLAARGSSLPRTRGHVVATVVLAASALIAGDLGAPWVKTPGLRWTGLDKTETQEWTAFGLFTVDKQHTGTSMIRADGTSALPMLEGKIAIPNASDDLPYVLHKDASPVLVLGAGGGRDVRVAQKHAQAEIHAVDANAILMRSWLRDRYRKWTGDVLDKPEVRPVIDDPRGYLRRSQTRFRTIVLSLADAQAAAATGALAAEPAGLYTVESIRDALDRLTPDGAVLLTRWDSEADRTIALAATALRAVGIAEPRLHMFGCGSGKSTGYLLTRSPLASRELSLLRAHCRKNKLNEAFAPDQPHGDLRQRLTSESDLSAVLAGAEVDLSPPTDDRPYLFATVPRRLLRATLRQPPAMRANGQALFVITSTLTLTAGVLGLGLLLPAATRRPRERERGARLEPIVYFSALGAALALAMSALATRLPALVGHPGHSLTTVQVAMFAFAAGGCLLAARQPAGPAEGAAGYRAQALVALLAVLALAIGPIIDRGLALPGPGRLAIAVAVIAPFGMLFGSLLPLGVRLVGSRTPELIPWSLAAGFFGAAVASTLAPLIAIALGNSAVLLAAGAACFLAATSVPRAARR